MNERAMYLFLLLALLGVLGGCTNQTALPEDPLAGWLEAARLDAQETSETLYQAALLEDTLVVYSTSTRMLDVAKSFQKEYPGLLVRVEDIREGELYGMLQSNYDEGRFECDIVCSADGRGIMANEYVPKGMVARYVPYDIAPHLLPGSDEALLQLAGEAILLCYNDAVYAHQPIGNWWELTEEQWRGKVCAPSPLRSVTTGMMLSAFLTNDLEMENAYLDRYGITLETGGVDAGRFFVQQMMENGFVFVNSSDEVAEFISGSTMGSEGLGIMVSSKFRLRDIGYALSPMEGLAPFDGIAAPINIMIAGGAPNINSAKLFIRWILGEADGQGEGYLPYLQVGAWPMRDDVLPTEGFSRVGIRLLSPDKHYLYENREVLDVFFREMIVQALEK